LSFGFGYEINIAGNSEPPNFHILAPIKSSANIKTGAAGFLSQSTFCNNEFSIPPELLTVGSAHRITPNQ
jgi:hypothetical protein